MRTPKPPLPAVIMACLLAEMAAAQQFERLQRTSAPDAPAPFADHGIPADIDGNGTIDILLRTGSVLVGDGQLGFTWFPPGTRIPFNPGIPIGLQFQLAGDTDQNGTLELIRTSLQLFPQVRTIVEIVPGNPGGTWGSPQPAGSFLGLGTTVALHDVDGDGDLDLFVRGQTGLGLLRNDGNGVFTDVSATNLPPTSGGPANAFADVDGDGDIDVAAAGAGPVQLLQNAGNGIFAAHPSSGLPTLPQAQALRFADADADGDPDLLIAVVAGTPLQLWLNMGAGVFLPSTAVLPPHGRSSLFTDLDGDGDADLLLVSDTTPPRLQAFRSSGGATFSPLAATTIDHGDHLGDPALADLDVDGDRDVVLGGSLLYVDGGSQTYEPIWRQPSAWTNDASTVVAGDLDGDGFADLASGGAVQRGLGDGYFEPTGQTLPAGGLARALFDADADGDLDLAWTTADAVTPQAGGLLLNLGGTFVALPQLPSGQLVGDVVHADFDGDGRDDLCSQSGILLQNLGGGAFAPAGAALTAGGPLAAADFDGDGRIDLVIGGPASWQVWLNTGGFAFSAGPALPGPITTLAAGDLDADGDPDIVTGYLGSSFGGSFGTFERWHNTPTGWSWAGALFDGTGEAPGKITITDVDEDGLLDIVGRKVWNNVGAGTFAERWSGGTGLGDVAVADIDLDGDPDLVYGGTFRAQVFANRHRHIGASLVPVLGRPYEVTLASRPGYGGGGDFVWPAIALAQIPPTLLPGIGVLHLDLAWTVVGAPVQTGADGTHTFATVVPAAPALANVEVFWQGLVAEPNGLRLTGFLRERLLP